MAQKTNGNFDFAFNFEVNLEGPLDARLTVENYADLSSVPLKYDGMVVSVVDDSVAANNGVYYYLDSSETWTKILDSGDTLPSGATTLNELTDVSAGSPSTGQVLKWNGSNWVAATDNSGSGSSDTISDGDSDIVVIDGNADTIQFTVDNTHCWSFNRYGHLLPVTNATYDIGSAERKVRHFFLSDNSLWLGELNKITIDPSTAEIKFQKRDATTVPPALSDRGYDEAQILSRTGKASLSNVSLAEYKAIAEQEGLDFETLYPSDDSAAFSSSKKLSTIESGKRSPEINVDAELESVDITSRLAETSGGILVISSSKLPITVDFDAMSKTATTEPLEIYHAGQEGFVIDCGVSTVWSVFDGKLETSITALSGQFIKLWYNASASRWEYLYRSI